MLESITSITFTKILTILGLGIVAYFAWKYYIKQRSLTHNSTVNTEKDTQKKKQKSVSFSEPLIQDTTTIVKKSNSENNKLKKETLDRVSRVERICMNLHEYIASEERNKQAAMLSRKQNMPGHGEQPFVQNKKTRGMAIVNKNSTKVNVAPRNYEVAKSKRKLKSRQTNVQDNSFNGFFDTENIKRN